MSIRCRRKCYIIVIIVFVSLEIKIQKLKYFKNVGNLLDLVVIGVSYNVLSCFSYYVTLHKTGCNFSYNIGFFKFQISLTQIAFNVINFIKTPELIREMLAKPFEYCDFSQLASKYV